MAIKKNEESQKSTEKEVKPSERTSFFTLKLPKDVMNAVLSPEDKARLNEVEPDPARPKKDR
jgi:hypothetical protein